MLYCPKCKINILESGQVTDLYHNICGCRTVPRWSEEKRKRLLAEKQVKDLEADIKIKQSVADTIVKEVTTINDKLQKRIEELEAALQRIDNWAKAYPIKAFPEPDLVEVHEILKAHGLSLDPVSASNMRHVLDGVKDIVEQALKPRT